MDDAVRVEVGGRVRAAMLAAGLTQQRVGDELGFGQSQVARRLKGEIAFDVVELDKVARLCGVPLTSLLPSEVAA